MANKNNEVIGLEELSVYDALIKHYIDNKMNSSSGGNYEAVEMTYAEYQALTPQQKNDGTIRYIADYPSDGGGSGDGYSETVLFVSNVLVTDMVLSDSFNNYDAICIIDIQSSQASSGEWLICPVIYPSSLLNSYIGSSRSFMTSYSGSGYFWSFNVISDTLLRATDFGYKYRQPIKVLGLKFGGSSLPDYSTTEQRTGQKWIDGKPIYQKTLVFDEISGNYSSSELNLDIETVTDFYAWVKLGTQGGSQWITVPFIEDQYYRCGCHYQSGDDKIYVKSSWGATDAIVTLKYTKTTDTSA